MFALFEKPMAMAPEEAGLSASGLNEVRQDRGTRGMLALPIDRIRQAVKKCEAAVGAPRPDPWLRRFSVRQPRTPLWLNNRQTLARPTPSLLAISVGVTPASFGRLIVCRLSLNGRHTVFIAAKC